MKSKKFLSLIAFFIAGSLFLTSCSDDDLDDTTAAPAASQQSIVEMATSSNDFSILVEALVKADLVDAVNGDGPYTVFAPTNEAFNRLFDDLGVDGIEDLSAEALKPILLNHVLSGKVESGAISTGYIETLNTFTPDQKGVNIFAQTDNTKSLTRGTDAQTGEISNKFAKGVMLNGNIQVVIADMRASNGVIHMINEVIMPSTVVDFAISNPNFSILTEAVVKAELVEALSAEGPYTVFAPTNAAFEKLFDALNVQGIEDLSTETLKPILLYHVVGDNVISSEVAKGTVGTLNTEASIQIDVVSGNVILNESSTVIAVDIQGTNGVIHAIDSVLLPQ